MAVEMSDEFIEQSRGSAEVLMAKGQELAPGETFFLDATQPLDKSEELPGNVKNGALIGFVQHDGEIIGVHSADRYVSGRMKMFPTFVVLERGAPTIIDPGVAKTVRGAFTVAPSDDGRSVAIINSGTARILVQGPSASPEQEA